MSKKPVSLLKIIFPVASVIIMGCLVVLITGILKAKREQIDYKVIPIEASIDVPSLSFSELDQVVQSDYANYVDGMRFVLAEMEVKFDHSSVTSGNATLTYFRFIDDSMEGGKIEANEFYFDLATNKLLRIMCWFGSGRSYSMNEESISGTSYSAPLAQFMEHAQQLDNHTNETTYILRATCAKNLMNIVLLDQDGNMRYYEEQLTSWPKSEIFNERSFTIIQID